MTLRLTSPASRASPACSGPLACASVTRGIVDLNTNPWLHGDHVHGVAGSEGPSPRIDVHVISRSASSPAGYRASLPGHLSSGIQAASLPIDPASHRAPSLTRSLSRCNGSGPRSPAILEQEKVRLDRPVRNGLQGHIEAINVLVG